MSNPLVDNGGDAEPVEQFEIGEVLRLLPGSQAYDPAVGVTRVRVFREPHGNLVGVEAVNGAFPGHKAWVNVGFLSSRLMPDTDNATETVVQPALFGPTGFTVGGDGGWHSIRARASVQWQDWDSAEDSAWDPAPRASCRPVPTAQAIERECDELAAMLLSKNAAYGDSALDPVECFASGLTVAQRLGVRMDDKLSRLMRGAGQGPDEDTLLDLAGYIILLRIARAAEQ